MATTARDEFDELMRDKERRHTHPEDDDDRESFLNLSDDDEDGDRTPPATTYESEDDDLLHPLPTNNGRRNNIPLTRYQANTGPKGVISDAQHFRDSQRVHRLSLRTTSQLGLTESVSTTTTATTTPSFGAQEDEKRWHDEDGVDIDDDDDFMRDWRLSRMRELQNGAYESRMHMRDRGKALYGALSPVDINGYLEAVERSPHQTIVVVYIYDDTSGVSALLEKCLQTLAHKHLDTRFVKLHFQDAEMEPAGVPALLAYQAGEKFAGLVPIMEEMPDDADVSARTLERILKRQQILK